MQAGAEGVHVNVVRADATGAAHARREVDRLERRGRRRPGAGRQADVGAAGRRRRRARRAAAARAVAGGFAQVGRTANAALVAAVLDAVGDRPGSCSSSYAGSGNFTRHLVARSPRRSHASDADPAAVERGRRNVPGASWSLRPPAIAADTVLLDPPREGADRAALAVAARARRRIVYVSCDPQTLGRDARALAASGFRLAGAVALDLMPQTFHVEVVASFERD